MPQKKTNTITSGAAAATYANGRKGYDPSMPGMLAIPAPNCYRCPLGQTHHACDLACLDFSFDYLDAVSVGSIAAVIIEPVQSAGGIIVPPEGYMKKLCDWCTAHSILLISDEAQTGLGRIGSNFAFEDEGVVPGIMSLSKNLWGRCAACGNCYKRRDRQNHPRTGFSHSTSHASDPLTVGIGLAVVRGRGLLIGIEIVTDRETRNPDKELMARLSDRCFELGLNINRVGGPLAVWRIAPPLTITRSEIDQALSILDGVFSTA